MKQARSPSARTEEWTFQRDGNHTSLGTANRLPWEQQVHFLRRGNHTSRGTTTSLPANKYYSI